ncbi:hypothetical protein O181_050508 [Austropuccinia psidii MF-1]|uniref:Uncharacterized protein n=1 Tax=Austropuccinia psidii MF-1 TaxID=1389203 RepID=A0A9Q3E1W0_9BASI|nr:hypothetical protein [Austropuccinia psidii MF-1]
MMLKAVMSLMEKNLKLLPPSKKEKSNPLHYCQSQSVLTSMNLSGPPNRLKLQLYPQPGHSHLPLPPPTLNHPWPALSDTQCLQNLNQSLTTIDAGISLEALLIRKR